MISNNKYKLLAKERINILFNQANEIFNKDPKLADRYVILARKIAMKARIGIPKELKRKFCKHCYSYLKPGFNCRVRTRDKKIIYYCMNCKKYTKIAIKRNIN
ncbi:ribonuclease P [Candidatus Woesearchaeota archaeon]|nr:ribonuclease P [Candidatus Woesearchaeota archaeon]